MQAGMRDERVTIRVSTTVDDGRGGQTVTWADVSPKWWVSIDPLSTREYLQAGALQNAMAHLVRGLYRSDVDVKRRLFWPLRGVTFEILMMRELSAIDRGTSQRVLELECVEVDS